MERLENTKFLDAFGQAIGPFNYVEVVDPTSPYKGERFEVTGIAEMGDSYKPVLRLRPIERPGRTIQMESKLLAYVAWIPGRSEVNNALDQLERLTGGDLECA
jgi:hypothetical protein